MNNIQSLLNQRSRREWANLSAFKTLIATPQAWATPVVLPAGARLYVKLGATVVADTVVYSVAGKNFSVKANTQAGVLTPVSYHERKETITAVYNANTLQLYVKTPMGKPKLIASK